jgi:NDP-sugar pyrophosphorylase family protein
VKDRETSRPLLFDQQLQLCGRGSDLVRPSQHPQSLAFSGVHVISPRLLPLMTDEGVFSIIPAYLDLAARGERILAFRADEYYWRDLGKPENVKQAAEEARRRTDPLPEGLHRN